MLRLYPGLGIWAKKCAVAVALVTPFLDGPPLAPCLIAAVLYGYVGHVVARRGKLRVGRHGIGCGERGLLLGRAECAMGFEVTGGDGGARLCFTRGRDVVAELWVDTAAERRAVLEAMGFGPRPSSLAVESPFRPELRLVGAVLLICFACASFFVGVTLQSIACILASALSVGVAGAMVIARDVRVGRDGVALSSPFRRMFVPFSEIQSVTEAGSFVRLHTRSGDIAFAAYAWPGLHAKMARAALVRALREGTSDVAASPEPCSSRRAGEGLRFFEGDFRASPRSLDDLLEVVESPRLPLPERARAAFEIARAPSADEAHLDRIRAVIEASASEQTRQTLTEALAGDDASALPAPTASAIATADTRSPPPSAAEDRSPTSP